MIRTLFRLSILTVSLTATVAFADLGSAWEKEFEVSFKEDYSFERCDYNVQRFFNRLERAKVPLETGRLAFITVAAPYTHFGVSNNRYDPDPRRLGWDHHVIALREVGNEYIVYDLDFGNTPKPIAFRDYAEQNLFAVQVPPPADYRGVSYEVKNYRIEICRVNTRKDFAIGECEPKRPLTDLL